MQPSHPQTLSRNQAIDCLQQYDILPTMQRIRIAQMLLSHDQHVSAEQVFDLANADGGKISKATVYNTLGLFASKGILREVNIDAERVFYDTNNTNHYHFYNQDTGELSDINPEQIAVEQLPDVPNGTVLDGVDIMIRVRSK